MDFLLPCSRLVTWPQYPLIQASSIRSDQDPFSTTPPPICPFALARFSITITTGIGLYFYLTPPMLRSRSRTALRWTSTSTCLDRGYWRPVHLPCHVSQYFLPPHQANQAWHGKQPPGIDPPGGLKRLKKFMPLHAAPAATAPATAVLCMQLLSRSCHIITACLCYFFLPISASFLAAPPPTNFFLSHQNPS